MQFTDNEEDDEIFFTDCQYWQDKYIRDWYKKASYIL